MAMMSGRGTSGSADQGSGSGDPGRGSADRRNGQRCLSPATAPARCRPRRQCNIAPMRRWTPPCRDRPPRSSPACSPPSTVVAPLRQGGLVRRAKRRPAEDLPAARVARGATVSPSAIGRCPRGSARPARESTCPIARSSGRCCWCLASTRSRSTSRAWSVSRALWPTSGLAVVTPEVDDLKGYRVTPRCTDVIEDAAGWLAAQRGSGDRTAGRHHRHQLRRRPVDRGRRAAVASRRAWPGSSRSAVTAISAASCEYLCTGRRRRSSPATSPHPGPGLADAATASAVRRGTARLTTTASPSSSTAPRTCSCRPTRWSR